MSRRDQSDRGSCGTAVVGGTCDSAAAIASRVKTGRAGPLRHRSGTTREPYYEQRTREPGPRKEHLYISAPSEAAPIALSTRAHCRAAPPAAAACYAAVGTHIDVKGAFPSRPVRSRLNRSQKPRLHGFASPELDAVTAPQTSCEAINRPEFDRSSAARRNIANQHACTRIPTRAPAVLHSQRLHDEAVVCCAHTGVAKAGVRYALLMMCGP